MKGVSAVIATILMLMITIALAGTAYLYITGVFTARIGIVLSVDGTSSTCNGTSPPPGAITVFVRNDGNSVSPAILIDLTYPNGTTVINACNALASINAGSSGSVTCARQLSGAGLYGVRTYTGGGGASATGSIYCSG